MSDPQAWREGLNEDLLSNYDEVLAFLRTLPEPHTLLDIQLAMLLLRHDSLGTFTVSMNERPNSVMAWSASRERAFIVMALQVDPGIKLKVCKATDYPAKVFYPPFPVGRIGAKDFPDPRWVPFSFTIRQIAGTR